MKKHVVYLLFLICFVSTLECPYGADTKFSQFSDGGNIQSGDTIVGLRGGVNTKFNAIPSTNLNTASTIVQRNALGAFNAGQITAENGLVSNNLNAYSGSAINVSNVSISSGNVNSTTGGSLVGFSSADFSSTLQADTISEHTANHGVLLEGVLVLDTVLGANSVYYFDILNGSVVTKTIDDGGIYSIDFSTGAAKFHDLNLTGLTA